MKKLMKWVRTDGNLHLKVLVGEDWVHYKNSPLATKDATISSNSGFATAQNGLRNGYKYVRVIELVDFLEHRKALELLNEIHNCLSEELPVEINLEGAKSLDIDGLLAVINWLKTVFKLSILQESLSFTGGSESNRSVLENRVWKLE